MTDPDLLTFATSSSGSAKYVAVKTDLDTPL